MIDPGFTGSSPKSAEIKGKESGFCPFIGFEEDPETALAYPAPYNFCNHCKPIAPVSLGHQRSACLTREFANCPVFQKDTLEPLPRELRGVRPESFKPTPWIPVGILVLVVMVTFIVLAILGVIRVPGLTPIPAETQPTIKVNTPTEVTPPPSVTVENTANPEPTNTLEATDTTPFTIHAIETPFGENPKLVIHQVQEGEGYYLMEKTYNTTEEAIKAINFELPQTLWVNKLLVIPVNTDDVTGLPQFSVREITSEGLTIEAYATRMQLNADALKIYNALPDGYLLEMGDFLIIPQ